MFLRPGTLRNDVSHEIKTGAITKLRSYGAEIVSDVALGRGQNEPNQQRFELSNSTEFSVETVLEYCKRSSVGLVPAGHSSMKRNLVLEIINPHPRV